MKPFNWRLLVGGLLVVLGILALLDTFLAIPFTEVLWGLLFVVGGLAFLGYLLGNRTAWWAIIPGLILLSIGVLILVEGLFPRLADDVGGLIFLGGTALAFWLVYIMNRNMWWSIIPAGVFTSLSLTLLVEQFTKYEGGVVFLLGLSITFALLTILPGLPGNRQWPWIPAGVLFVVSLLAWLAIYDAVNYLWAIALIVVGLFLILRPMFSKKS